MDTEVRVEQPNKVENSSQKSVKKLDDNYVVVEAKNIVAELPSPSMLTADRTAYLEPITPDSNREGGAYLLDSTSSPLTLGHSCEKGICFDSHPSGNLYASIGGSPHTPIEGVFDPFAPGPDKLMLAPHCKKYMQESRRSIARQLNFDSSVDFVLDANYETDADAISDDEILLEAVFDTLFEAIVSKQTEELLGSIGFKTPNSATRLSGITETCPGAPVKPARKVRNIDPGLCRKLEF